MSDSTPVSQEGREHVVKCWPRFFEAVQSGVKTFEIRSALDRDFSVGDTLVQQEWNPDTKQYTGRECRHRITYITDWEQSQGRVVMGLESNALASAQARIAELERELQLLRKELSDER